MAKNKRIWIVAAVVVAVLIIAAFVVQHFLNADTYRGRIEAALSDSLGRQVQLGHLSFSLFSGSLVAASPSIADDPAFSNQPFLTAKDIRIGVEVGPLLFHRELHITGFSVDQPKITLLRREDGTWNYSSLGGQGKARPAATGNPLPNLTVNRLDVKDGTVTVGTLPAQGQPHVYSDVNISATNFSFAKSFPFTITAKLPADGTLEIDGNAGPLSQRDASLTPFTAQVSVKDANLLASAFVDPSEGIAGIADLDARISSNGQVAHVDGKAHLTGLKLAKDGSPSSEPVDAQFSVDQDLQSLSGKIQSANVQVGKAAMAIAGTYQTRGNQTSIQITASGQNMPIDSLVAFLPSLGIELPAGSRLQGGTLTANLNVSGPTSAPVISGPVQIANTRLAGFNLGQKLAGIRALTGAKTGSDTTIQTLSTNLHRGPAGTRTDNLVAVVTGLGSATGNGSISPAGALDYHLRVKINVAGAGGAMSSAVGLLSGGLGSRATQNGIPIAISGTTAHPVFAPEMGRMVGNALQNKGRPAARPLGKALGGLLRH